MYHPAWKDWFKAKHHDACQQSGTAFESYIESILSLFHGDYINPDPAGRHGDFGCDGVAEAGRTVYACYGQRPTTMTERGLAEKIPRDFQRALDKWHHMTTWRFITNGIVGPLATQSIVELQASPGPRSIAVTLWRPDHLWREVLQGMPVDRLSILFPGAPGVTDVELSEMTELLEHLEVLLPEEPTDLAPQEEDKMEYNSLPESNRIELSEGRHQSARLERWFGGQGDTELEDKKAARFRQLYLEHKDTGLEPRAILERLYVAVGGQDFRMDSQRANAVFAVTAYFFDKCHIFERPPRGWSSSAATSIAGGAH